MNIDTRVAGRSIIAHYIQQILKYRLGMSRALIGMLVYKCTALATPCRQRREHI